MSEKDSLFGSPPPSPARGRSPSLALPESSGWRLDAQTSSQNVGTIALPGSQSHSSELPVFQNTALPSGNSVLQLRPPAQSTQTLKKRRQHTSHKAHSSRISSPAPHSTRTDRTLRDLVGLISHFEPVATVSSSRPPPIAVPSRVSKAPAFHPPGSAQNPIEIDEPGPADAVNSALIALAGTVAGALKLPTTPQETPSLSKPTVNTVLHCIKHDPKLIPALQATYEYLGSIPNNSQPAPRPFSHVTKNQSDLEPSKKRKRTGTQVPAGAGHWDIPFPFARGEEPSSYPSDWHLERGRRVLGELLGLFERGFAKARGGQTASAAQTLPRRQPKKERVRPTESVPVCETAEKAIVGIAHEGCIPGPGAEGDGLDYQRMADWLSSVPPLPSPLTMDSTNFTDMAPPSPSDSTPVSSNSLLDFMATLGPGFGDTLIADGKEHNFDYARAFDELGVGIGGDDMTMFESGPTSQSINDITAFSMPDLPSPALHIEAQESVLDPALATSQKQGNHQSQSDFQLSGASPTPSTPPVDFQDPACQVDTSNALTSLGQSAAGSFCQRLYDQCAPTSVGTELDFGDSTFTSLPSVEAFFAQQILAHAAQSIDAHSLLTVPTTSGSSSQRGSSTPTLHAQNPMSPTSSISAGLPASGKTKVERKAAVLARAKEHRDQLLKELERVQVQRWELLIEGGVLRNLGKTGSQ